MKERFQLDPAALTLFRIALGLILLIDLGIRFTDLHAHYTDDGILPRDAVTQLVPSAGNPFLSLHMLSGDSTWIFVLFALQTLAAVCLVIGWKSRLAAALSWFLLMSIQVRNPMILNGADHLLRLLLLFACFLPLDKKSQRNSSWAGVALLIQVCMVYAFTVLYKTDPAWRSTFTAGLMALQSDFYATPLGHALTAFPRTLKTVTALTFIWEALGPILLLIGFPFRRFRLIVISLFILLHLGLGLCFELGLWPLASIAALLPFLPLHQSETGQKITSITWTERMVLVLVSLSLVVNLTGVLELKNPLHPVTQTLGLDQRWDMFAPYPIEDDGWFVVKSGNVNLLHPGNAVDDTLPIHYSQDFPNHRWRKYFLRLRRESTKDHLPLFADWIERNPHYFIGDSEHSIRSIECIFYQEITTPEGKEEPPTMFHLFSRP